MCICKCGVSLENVQRENPVILVFCAFSMITIVLFLEQNGSLSGVGWEGGEIKRFFLEVVL